MPLIKQLAEAALVSELEQHIKSTDEQNLKNGATVRQSIVNWPSTLMNATGAYFGSKLLKKATIHFVQIMVAILRVTVLLGLISGTL